MSNNIVRFKGIPDFSEIHSNSTNAFTNGGNPHKASIDVLDIMPTSEELYEAGKNAVSKTKEIAAKTKEATEEAIVSKTKEIFEKISDAGQPEYFDDVEIYNDVIAGGCHSIIEPKWAADMKSFLLFESNGRGYFDTAEELDMIVYYLKNIQDCPTYCDKSLEEQLGYAKQLMNYDRQNGSRILHSTPMLMNGKVDTGIASPDSIKYIKNMKYEGEYLKYYSEYGANVVVPLCEMDFDSDGYLLQLDIFQGDERLKYIDRINQYYSDIMANSENYTDYFNKQASENVSTLFLAPFVHDNKGNCKGTSGSWAGFTDNNVMGFAHVKSNIVIDTNLFRDEENTYMYNYMIDTYTHELGHGFANASSKSWDEFDNSQYWRDIYKQLEPYCDDKTGPLRDYANENVFEAFAECVSEYFGGISGIYNPDDLKAIDIVVDGVETNLYNVMDKILNGYI